METSMTKLNKALAGYHLLVIIAHSDGVFSSSEEKVVKEYLSSNPLELENLDAVRNRLKEMKKDDTVKNLLETKFDRETICILLGVTKNEIAEILQHCSYSEAFIQTANDLQILDAISQCYEQYKVLKK
jgi:F0F1-type ATP synthase delta subunit